MNGATSWGISASASTEGQASHTSTAALGTINQGPAVDPLQTCDAGTGRILTPNSEKRELARHFMKIVYKKKISCQIINSLHRHSVTRSPPAIHAGVPSPPGHIPPSPIGGPRLGKAGAPKRALPRVRSGCPWLHPWPVFIVLFLGGRRYRPPSFTTIALTIRAIAFWIGFHEIPVGRHGPLLLPVKILVTSQGPPTPSSQT